MAALTELVFTVEVFNGAETERFRDETFTGGEYTVDVRQEQDTLTGLPILASVSSLNLALTPLYLSEDEAQELDDLLEHPRAFPTLPVHGVPRGDRSRLSRKKP